MSGRLFKLLEILSSQNDRARWSMELMSKRNGIHTWLMAIMIPRTSVCLHIGK